MRHLRLFIVSFLMLYFELLFIRWIPDGVHVLSFFGTFVLLSCFLGMGVGLARPPAHPDGTYVNRFLGWCTAIIFFLTLFLYFRVDVPPVNQDMFLNDDSFIVGPRSLHVNLYVTVMLFCTLLSLTFVPLGTLLRRYLDETPPLLGYTVNILASLAGIGVFSLMSYLGTPPGVWLTLGFALLWPLATRRRAVAMAVAAGLCVFVFALEPYLAQIQGYEKYWSPYYNIRLYTQANQDLQIYIGNSCLLTAVDLSPEKQNNLHRIFYGFPYRFQPHPKRVLVLGAGMGNDVAMALLEGVEHVDAVEIDPRVARIGLDRHPLHPYRDPRVHLINDDARHYLSHCQERYDLIIFGTLDSHGLFSYMSSLKMENYVYTRQSFEQARKLLEPDGILYVTVGFWGKFVPVKLFNTLSQVFGKPPQFYIYRNLYSMFVCGPTSVENAEDPQWDLLRTPVDKLKVSAEDARYIPTDDWPQLYLARPSIPREYLGVLGLLLVLSFAMIRFGIPGSAGFRFNGHYFFLGAGFMLLETKSISELGLLFGSTWLVNSVVISAILLMIFLANVFLLKTARAPDQRVVYALLLGGLILLYVLPLREMATGAGPAVLGGTVLLLTLPLLFAALIFGTSFARTTEPGASLASNILGSMVGGVLEYASLAWGLHALYLVALLLYGLSFVFRRREG